MFTALPDHRTHLSAATLKRVDALQRRHPVGEADSLTREPWQYGLWSQLNSSYTLIAHETVEVQAAEAKIEVCRPYWSRRLIEFSISLPRRVLTLPGESRSLHRLAMAKALPPEVLLRMDKAEFSCTYDSLLPDLAMTLTDGSLVVPANWVTSKWREEISRVALDAEQGRRLRALWSLFSTAAACEHRSN